MADAQLPTFQILLSQDMIDQLDVARQTDECRFHENTD